MANHSPALSVALLVFGLCASASGAQSTLADTVCELVRVEGSDAAPGDLYGRAVAVAGNTAFVGAPRQDNDTGAVYVFERTPDGWVEVQKLVASDATENLFFGFSLATMGNHLLVGAPGCACKNSCCHENSGAVYAFGRTAAGWGETQELTGPGDDGYGFSVAVYEDEALIGAPFVYHGGIVGEVYLLEFAGGVWSTTENLEPLGDFAFNFGAHVALTKDLALGVGWDDHPPPLFPSELVLFERVAGVWSPVLHVQEDPGAIPGVGIALTPDFLYVGNPWKNSFRGQVKVYTRAGGWPWSKTFSPGALQEGDEFGSSITVIESGVLVGAPGDDEGGPDAGAVWIFEGGPPADKLLPPDPQADDQFGRSLAADGSRILVGSSDDRYGGFGKAYSIECMGQSTPESPCGGTTYCTTSPNSVGPGARIATLGEASVSSPDFTLLATELPAQGWGLFFYGPQQTTLPLGDGTLCVGGIAGRLGPLQADAQGTARQVLDFTDPPHAPTQITALSTWNFQYWYRDPAAGGAGQNLSDAIEVFFCP
jgi:FG-GAP repeat protein